jgi:hypothetical protein
MDKEKDIPFPIIKPDKEDWLELERSRVAISHLLTSTNDALMEAALVSAAMGGAGLTVLPYHHLRGLSVQGETGVRFTMI